MARWRVWKSDGIWRAQQYGSKKIGYAGGMSNALWLVSTVEKGKNLDLLISGTKLELPPTHCPECQRADHWYPEEYMQSLDGGTPHTILAKACKCGHVRTLMGMDVTEPTA